MLSWYGMPAASNLIPMRRHLKSENHVALLVSARIFTRLHNVLVVSSHILSNDEYSVICDWGHHFHTHICLTYCTFPGKYMVCKTLGWSLCFADIKKRFA